MKKKLLAFCPPARNHHALTCLDAWRRALDSAGPAGLRSHSGIDDFKPVTDLRTGRPDGSPRNDSGLIFALWYDSPSMASDRQRLPSLLALSVHELRGIEAHGGRVRSLGSRTHVAIIVDLPLGGAGRAGRTR